VRQRRTKRQPDGRAHSHGLTFRPSPLNDGTLRCAGCGTHAGLDQVRTVAMRNKRLLADSIASPKVADEAERALSGWLRWVARRLAARVRSWSDRYRPQALYHRLSGLSDAELQRRGLSRETLAWHVEALRDRTTKRPTRVW
jgi:hypothetical protein